VLCVAEASVCRVPKKTHGIRSKDKSKPMKANNLWVYHGCHSPKSKPSHSGPNPGILIEKCLSAGQRFEL
jgi:hypothetical protein